MTAFVCAFVRVEFGFIQFALGSFYAVHINIIVNILKVYMERKNRQLELIRFRKKYRIYSRLLFRTDEVNATRNFDFRCINIVFRRVFARVSAYSG